MQGWIKGAGAHSRGQGKQLQIGEEAASMLECSGSQEESSFSCFALRIRSHLVFM